MAARADLSRHWSFTVYMNCSATSCLPSDTTFILHHFLGWFFSATVKVMLNIGLIFHAVHYRHSKIDSLSSPLKNNLTDSRPIPLEIWRETM